MTRANSDATTLVIDAVRRRLLAGRVLPGQAMANGHNQLAASLVDGSLLPTNGSDALRGRKWSYTAIRHDRDVRELVLRTFSQSDDPPLDLFLNISHREWKRLLTWLDASGLALYFFDRMRELELLRTLPQFVTERLHTNVRDNVERTRGLIAESVAVQRGFQSAGVRYAVLKGLSLYPSAVTQLELRHQFDLDYLIAYPDADKAGEVLEQVGYRRRAVGERCWEFKKGETPAVSARDLYKDLVYRGVELHFEHATADGLSRLDHSVGWTIEGITMPFLSPIDLFISQAMDIFKDVCSSFTRASHLLEFYRHVLSRFDDDLFWNELRLRLAHDRTTQSGIAIVSYLVSCLMGEFTPSVLTAWMRELSPATRLWIDRYGRHSVFAEPPGTKLYLLLQRELQLEGISPRRTLRQSLLPTRVPGAVIHGSHREHISTQVARYRVQFRFFLSRFRFHCIEGSRFAIESYRWNRHLKELQ